MNELSLTCTRHIKAAPQDVFEAWLDPAKMAQFMSPRPEMHVREATSDARVGGRFFVMMVADRDLPHAGKYLEITPHTRLIFTWEAPWSAPGTQVTIDFAPHEGGTFVTLSQVRFADELARDSHLEGWTGILSKLAALTERNLNDV